MNRKIAAGLTILSIGACILGGCKKQEEGQKAQGPETAPAPATTQAAPATTAPAGGAAGGAKSGEALFKQQCAACHPDGGNTMQPKKTLHKADMQANNITKPEDIVKIMRNPGQGMPKFDATTVSDQDATAIAEYILKTY